jgi:hypothetical protein
MGDKITLEDIEQYQHLLNKAPAFLLGRMAKRNSNLVSKFESRVKSYIDNLSDAQRKKLDILLNSDVDDLQSVMNEAYLKADKKQYKILADPSNKEFIELNLDELRKIVYSDAV